MKKFIISLALLVPFLTGCADVDTRVTINDDKTASVATSVTYKGDFSDLTDATAQNIVENYAKFLDPLYVSNKDFSARLSTITASKSVKNIETNDLDLSSLGFVSNHEDKKFVEVKKNFLVTSYNVDMTFNPELIDSKFEEVDVEDVKSDTSVGLKPEYLQMYGDISDLQQADRDDDLAAHLDPDTKAAIEQDLADDAGEENPVGQQDLNLAFSIQLPAFASFNNAHSAQGNIYTWNLSKDEPTEIKLQYVKYSGYAIGFVVLVGFGLLVLLVKAILKRDEQKRMDNVENIV